MITFWLRDSRFWFRFLSGWIFLIFSCGFLALSHHFWGSGSGELWSSTAVGVAGCCSICLLNGLLQVILCSRRWWANHCFVLVQLWHHVHNWHSAGWATDPLCTSGCSVDRSWLVISTIRRCLLLSHYNWPGAGLDFDPAASGLTYHSWLHPQLSDPPSSCCMTLVHDSKKSYRRIPSSAVCFVIAHNYFQLLQSASAVKLVALVSIDFADQWMNQKMCQQLSSARPIGIWCLSFRWFAPGLSGISSVSCSIALVASARCSYFQFVNWPRSASWLSVHHTRSQNHVHYFFHILSSYQHKTYSPSLSHSTATTSRFQIASEFQLHPDILQIKMGPSRLQYHFFRFCSCASYSLVWCIYPLFAKCAVFDRRMRFHFISLIRLCLGEV